MRALVLILGSALLIALFLASSVQPGRASSNWTLTTLHNFTGNDGAQPTGRLIFDQSGALYGTTDIGGAAGSIINGGCASVSVCGTVFKLTPPAKGGVWTETVLHAFNGNIDGYLPLAGLIPRRIRDAIRDRQRWSWQWLRYGIQADAAIDDGRRLDN